MSVERRQFLNEYNTLGLLPCVGGQPYNRQVPVAHMLPVIIVIVLSHAQSAMAVTREG